jgi:carbon storage regulator
MGRLILARKAGQKILVGSDVTIEVFSVEGSYVRIAITAPADVPVHREEVVERDRMKLKAETPS